MDTIGSDHSPAPPELKNPESGDFREAWGGIASCQHAFPAFLSAHGRPYGRVALLTARNPAARLGFSERKGQIAVGFDADFAIMSPRDDQAIQSEDLRYRHAISPYVGREISWGVDLTVVRGRVAFCSKSFSQKITRSTSLPPIQPTNPCSQFLAKPEPT